MADIIGWAAGLALIGLVVRATLAVAGGRGRIVSRRKGGGVQMMAAMMFGLGSVLDPPQRHAAEARDETPKGSPESGDPERDD
ncbi:hypothetical protein [Brevundimonas sp.]|uniref:hypothetical protein n=1 Tax=Brevundimonas sp. TaxID=1871086 RepID=UPI002FCA2CC1